MAGDANTKYLIRAKISVDGVVEKPDIIGAIFGQTEGLLGNEMDLRDLQKGARIGRIEVDIQSAKGKTSGTIILPSGLEKVESCLLGAGLETIERIGPAKAHVEVTQIEDAQASRRQRVKERAKQLLAMLNDDPNQNSSKILEEVKDSVSVANITTLPGTKIPAGPNATSSDALIIVEGRNDVQNLLKMGIKNTVAVGGASVPQEIIELSMKKTVTIFVDGDRGGELIAKELIQTCKVDFVARAPATREVEELPHKMVSKCLQTKQRVDQFLKSIDAEDMVAAEVEPEVVDTKPERRRRRSRKGRDKDEEDVPEATPEPDVKPEPRGRSRKGRSERPAKGDGEKRSRVNNKDRKAAHDAHSDVRNALESLKGTLQAQWMDEKLNSKRDQVPVRDLAEALRGIKKDAPHTILFDGVVTQRLLDLAADKGVARVVGVKMGNVARLPQDVEVLTQDDL